MARCYAFERPAVPSIQRHRQQHVVLHASLAWPPMPHGKLHLQLRIQRYSMISTWPYGFLEHSVCIVAVRWLATARSASSTLRGELLLLKEVLQRKTGLGGCGVRAGINCRWRVNNARAGFQYHQQEVNFTTRRQQNYRIHSSAIPISEGKAMTCDEADIAIRQHFTRTSGRPHIPR